MTTFLLLMAALLLPASASTLSEGCFKQHIQESISVNKFNKEAYSKLGGRQAKKVINTLVTSEYLTTAAAAYYDRQAKFFRDQGMDLFCKEFVSMKENPSSPSIGSVPTEAFRKIEWKKLKSNFKNALDSSDADKIQKVSMDAILLLKKQPNYHCFARHLMESIYRIAYYVETREREAQSLGIRSPKKLMLKVVKAHLKAISFATFLDNMAMPVQKKGVAILCGDFPNLLKDLPYKQEQVYNVKN